MSYIDLADVGTTREVLASQPPRGVRNLIVAAAGVLAVLSVATGLLRIQQSETLGGQIVAQESPRAVTATSTGQVAEVLVDDGQAVGAGQPVLRLDSRAASDRLAVLQREEASAATDLGDYERLRQAALGSGNPFDPTAQPNLYYALEQYRQQVAQAADARRQQDQSQAATRASAEVVLAQSQTSANAIEQRSAELSRLAQAIRSAQPYTSSDAYCQALFQSYQQGRPLAAGTGAEPSAQSAADYDAGFVVRVEAQIADLATQQAGYDGEIARLRAELSAPGLDPAADSTAAATAAFMLSLTAQEQERRQTQTSLTLESMTLRLDIDRATLAAPVAGTAELSLDWRPGDSVQAGQTVFTVVPDSGQKWADVAVPARLAPALTTGRVLPCALPVTVGAAAPAVSCRVERLSAAYRSDSGGQTYYVARVIVEPTRSSSAKSPDPDLGLLPGVPLTVTVPIREVTVMRWLGEKIGFLQAD